MKTNAITTTEQAAARIETKLIERKAALAEKLAFTGPISEEVKKGASALLDGDFAKITEFDFAVFAIVGIEAEIAGLETTQKADLIFPAGKFVMIPKGERLVSPAGFHPDEMVFLKPASGVITDKLPDSSNLSFYDFTK